MMYNTTDDAGQQESSSSESGQARPVLFGLVVAVISLALMLC